MLCAITSDEVGKDLDTLRVSQMRVVFERHRKTKT